MDAVEFLIAWRELCRKAPACGHYCELSLSAGDTTCRTFAIHYPERAVEIVSAWKAKQERSKLDIFKEKHPNPLLLNSYGLPHYKPFIFGLCKGNHDECEHLGEDPAYCWNMRWEGDYEN